MKRRISLAVVLCMGLILAGCLRIKTPDLAISGTVIDADTGQGVGGVEIVVGSQGTTVTSENGSWSFARAKKGSQVSAKKEGWKFQPESQIVKGEGDVPVFSGERIPYGISGSVFDDKGSGIEGVLIIFVNDQGEVAATAISDSKGFFAKTGLKGTYRVGAFKDGWLFTPPERTVNGADDEVYFYGSPSVIPVPDGDE